MNSRENNGKYINVGDGHSIYFETYGNPKGVNILFLHGGPGGSFTEKDKRFFDADLFNVIFFDQRGSGKSKPSGSIQHNTTKKIIADITKLLNYLQLNKVILFGGSWGSTLSMLYAIKNPDRVSALVLRGIFTGNKRNRRHFEKGGTKLFFPKEWERYTRLVPDNQSSNVSDFYFNKILSSNGQTREKYSYELVRYGLSVSKHHKTSKEIENMLDSIDFTTKAVIQSHYAINNFFIPDNYILENLEKIGSIPVYLVQGRYDMICPPKFAVEINAMLQNSTLFLVSAGHSSHDCEIETSLKSILHELAISS